MQSGKGGEMRSYRRARRCWGSKEETEKRLGFLKRRGTQSMKGENVNKKGGAGKGAGRWVSGGRFRIQGTRQGGKKEMPLLQKSIYLEKDSGGGGRREKGGLQNSVSESERTLRGYKATDTFIEKDGWTYDKVTRGRNQKMERTLRGSAELRRSGNMLRGPGRLREYRGARNRQRRCEQRGDTACNQEPEDREGGRK